MSNERKKVGRREKYPFATWQVGDEFIACAWAHNIKKVSHRLLCAANNRKGNKYWRFATKIKLNEIDQISIVTIRRIK